MKIHLGRRYLVFPVNPGEPLKKLLFYDDGKLVYEIDVSIDSLHPSFHAYIDMAPLMGTTLDVIVNPDTEIPLEYADTIDRRDLYQETFRPYYHFTEKNGWTNDPNGLVLSHDGTYHLYYQLNPAAPTFLRSNVHWGHAVSSDLIHWEQKGIALFPDERGTVYSGSGIRDRENRAGFGKNALLFFYTAAGNRSERSKGVLYSQCLAVSTDNGNTLRRYEHNPVISHVAGFNRDPKTVWCDELSAFLCVLYLENHTFTIFRSDNLLNWHRVQTIELPGDSECPDLYPITAEDGTRHWVFSGAGGSYLIGKIEKGQFIPEQGVRRIHSGSVAYASQTFSDLPQGRRIGIAWEQIVFPDKSPFASQMSLPLEHTLIRDEKGYTLAISPAKESEALHQSPLTFSSVPGGGFKATPEKAAVEIHIVFPAFGQKAKLSMFGYVIEIDGKAGEVRLDQERMLLVKKTGECHISFYIDINSLEVFAENRFACWQILADENRPVISFEGNPDTKVWGWNLKSIFKRKPT